MTTLLRGPVAMKTKAEIIDDIIRKEGGDQFTVAPPAVVFEVVETGVNMGPPRS